MLVELIIPTTTLTALLSPMHLNAMKNANHTTIVCCMPIQEVDLSAGSNQNKGTQFLMMTSSPASRLLKVNEF